MVNRRVTLGLFIALLIAASIVIVAYAGPNQRPLQAIKYTATLCDNNSPPKYWCTYVRYDTVGTSNINVLDRSFRGGIDGGAKKWRIDYAKDWRWNGSSWVFVREFGAGSWRFDVSLSQWFCYCSTNAMIGGAIGTVTISLRYDEWTQSAGWYSWYQDSQHILYNP